MKQIQVIVMTRDYKIKILDMLRGGIITATVGLKFRSYFILKLTFC